jgi:DNA end-binding protein Ku
VRYLAGPRGGAVAAAARLSSPAAPLEAAWRGRAQVLDRSPAASYVLRAMAATRPSWKGFLRLSLVTVPVRAYTAAQNGNEIRLNQLHANCNQRVKHQKTCPEHGALANEDIVSGYEYAKGQYVVVDLEELQKLRPERDSTIRIDGFIEMGSIAPIYLSGRTYYLLPDGAVGQKPYQLLLRAMQDGAVEAVAQVVIAGREQLVVIRPLGRLLGLHVLNHDAKVRRAAELEDELVEEQVLDAELALTKTLIEATRLADFNLARYGDTFLARLTQLIQAKVDGQEVIEVRDPEEPKILNLMEALKQSVAKAKLG